MTIDKESWEDIRPKAAVAANVGLGPGPIFGSGSTTPQQYPDKLMDVSELADYLGGNMAAGTPVAKAMPRATASSSACPWPRSATPSCYRESQVKEAGFAEFPKDTTGFLELCKAHAGQGHAGRLPARQRRRRWQQLRALAAVEPWRQDGRRERQGRDQQPRDARGHRLRQELYKTFIPGTEGWLDVNNNRAFLAGQVSVIANGVSAYSRPRQQERPEARRDR